MRTRYDQLSKAILAVLLRRVAHVEVAREIPGHVDIADLWVWPRDPLPADRGMLGLLGRMVELGPCLIEPFSSAPRTRDIRGCILEQYALDRGQVRDAEREGKDEPAFPGMWVIATGSPDSVIAPMELRPMDGWPEGFLHGRSFDPFRLVIVRKLPKTPETLFLRLLSRGVTFSEAVQELIAQSGGALSQAWTELEPVLLAFRREFPQDLKEEEDMEALRHLENVYAEMKRELLQEGLEKGLEQGFEKGIEKGIEQGIEKGIEQGIEKGIEQGIEKGIEQGIEKGRHDGLLEAIEALCEVLEIEFTDDRRESLAKRDTAGLKQVLAGLRTSRRWPEP